MKKGMVVWLTPEYGPQTSCSQQGRPIEIVGKGAKGSACD